MAFFVQIFISLILELPGTFVYTDKLRMQCGQRPGKDGYYALDCDGGRLPAVVGVVTGGPSDRVDRHQVNTGKPPVSRQGY